MTSAPRAVDGRAGASAWIRRCIMCRGIGFLEGVVEAPFVIPCGCFEGAVVREVAAFFRRHFEEECSPHVRLKDWPLPRSTVISLMDHPSVPAEVRRSLVFHRLGHAFSAVGYAAKSWRMQPVRRRRRVVAPASRW